VFRAAMCLFDAALPPKNDSLPSQNFSPTLDGPKIGGTIRFGKIEAAARAHAR